MKQSYAYFIMVKGKKRIGGMLHADSLDDAAKRIISISKLTLKKNESPFHTDYDWMFRGEKASVAIWLPSEAYKDIAEVL